MTTLSNRIEEACKNIDAEFWVPGVGNGQIGEFVKFVLKHENDRGLIGEFDLMYGALDLAKQIERLVHELDREFWVPGVGNHQIAHFVRFASDHDLWPKFAELVKESE